MKCFAALALFCGALALNASGAQDPKTPPEPAVPKPARAVYAVVNGDAVLLAEVVGTHFKGEATVIAAPGNVILVSGTSAPEVLKLLERLDKKPRTIEVEVTIAEVPAKDWKDAANTDELAKSGRRIKLTVVEGQPVSTQTGGSKPLLSKDIGLGGKGQTSVSYQDVSTTLKLTARTGAGETVVVDLNLKDSQIKQPEPGDEVAAPAMVDGSLTARVNVPTGKAVVARTVRTEGKAGAVAVVLVTARVVPDAPDTTPKRR